MSKASHTDLDGRQVHIVTTRQGARWCAYIPCWSNWPQGNGLEGYSTSTKRSWQEGKKGWQQAGTVRKGNLQNIRLKQWLSLSRQLQLHWHYWGYSAHWGLTYWPRTTKTREFYQLIYLWYTQIWGSSSRNCSVLPMQFSRLSKMTLWKTLT